jgi:outer membrane protein OmpA-like peptidoglycan-associated protein
LTRLSETLGDRADSGVTKLREEYKQAQTKQDERQFQVLVQIAALQKRIDAAGADPQARTDAQKPAWRQRQTLRVTFDLGKSDLSERGKFALQSALSDLQKSPEYRVEIFGYTDTSGSPAINAALSLARAQEARDFIVDVLHLEPSKMLVVGRQRGVDKFGPPRENRAVEIRVFVYGTPNAGTSAAAAVR